MTRNQLYDLIYSIGDCLNTLQYTGEETMGLDEDDELPKEHTEAVEQALQDLEKAIY
jgi:hypothetical protein